METKNQTMKRHRTTLVADTEIPFDYTERVTTIPGVVNGHPFDRFLFDTGAPMSFLREDIAADHGLWVDSRKAFHIDSLKFGELDVGPIDMRTTPSTWKVAGLVGTREVAGHCVAFDIDKSVCTIGRSTHTEEPFSPLELFRGRPIVHVQHGDVRLTFVFDTGSSGNWLFVPGQKKLSNAGAIVPHTETGKTAWGDAPITRKKVLQNTSIGGKVHSEVEFMISDKFTGEDAPEDGILGIGGLAVSGKVVIDFPLGRLVLIDDDST